MTKHRLSTFSRSILAPLVTLNSGKICQVPFCSSHPNGMSFGVTLVPCQFLQIVRAFPQLGTCRRSPTPC